MFFHLYTSIIVPDKNKYFYSKNGEYFLHSSEFEIAEMYIILDKITKIWVFWLMK